MKKKFFSILLSLVMILTMIPFATMTAFADDNTVESFLKGKIAVRDVFGGNPPRDAYKTYNGKSAFLSEQMIPLEDYSIVFHYHLTFNYNGKEVSIPWNTPVKKSGNNYQCTSEDGITCTFRMSLGSLSQINVNGTNTWWDGNYHKSWSLAPAYTAVNDITSIKISAQRLIGDALGDGAAPVVGAYFDAGLEAVAAAKTVDEVREATVKHIGLIYESKAVAGTRISQNKLQANKNGKIVVSFEAPKFERIVGYVIQRATDKQFTKNLKTYNTRKTTFINAKHLKEGKRYYYQVYAKVQLSDGKIVTTNLSNIRYIKCKRTR